MKKSLLFVFLLLSVSSYAQKVKFTDIPVRSLIYPVTPLPENFKTYSVKLDASDNWLKPLSLTREELKSKIKFDSFQPVEGQADLTINAKITKTDSESQPVIVTINLSYEVLDNQGRTLKKDNIQKSSTQGASYPNTIVTPKGAVYNAIDEMVYSIHESYDYAVNEGTFFFAHLKKDDEATYDYIGFEKAFADVKNTATDYIWKPNDQAFKASIQPALNYWDTQKDKLDPTKKEQKNLYFVCTYNLALINTLIYNIADAEKYAALMDKSDVKDLWGNQLKKEIEKRKRWKTEHDTFKENLASGKTSIYRSSATAPVDKQKATVNNLLGISNTNPGQDALNQQAIQKGFVVTAKGDTLHGEILDIDVNIQKRQIEFIPTGKPKQIFKPTDLQAFSAAGASYEIIATAICRRYYKSPDIELVYLTVNKAWLFLFNKSNTIGEYPSVDLGDAAAYMVNYKKKMVEIFKSCPDVTKKINSGTYNIKSNKADDLMKIVQDYETSCGSQNFEKYNKKISAEYMASFYQP
ncbi:hypothetical protein QNI19_27380 [Cytophagaceae bacterium DM2B3-1]|uniref:Uncharacterized protein n=1 Tax=Xanthocytophaga flava TaxID=3048013 RepID=A0ABT7CT58_9BACT|nr:hypothetical protein [Xanthocytophaga flavus]MDJ1471467.1 hypothetical protein [Xanthocytophaga flavus]MDJ1496686.1 hypothetical protein [Xanthocytophaga flavus]